LVKVCDTRGACSSHGKGFTLGKMTSLSCPLAIGSDKIITSLQTEDVQLVKI
jgi:hypothetical protein